jgi:hypothetical protein
VPTLFSYVVDHDNGFAPNPMSGYCSLVHCKFDRTGKRRSIVELAIEDDWIIGTGGASAKSSGNGTILYLMRVDEKLPFTEFLADARFRGREDCVDLGLGNKYALISSHYFYFGMNAVDVSALPGALRIKGLVKTGAGYRRDYPEKLIPQLGNWFEQRYQIGMHGEPCGNRF